MRIERLAAAALLLTPLTASCDLTSGANASGNGGKAGQAAGAVLRLQVIYGKDFALKDYDMSVMWSGELVGEPIDGPGNTSPFTQEKTYKGKLDTDGVVVLTQTVTDERPGTWRFTATTDGWSSDCVRDLPSGGSVTMNWTAFRGGCADGVVFP